MNDKKYSTSKHSKSNSKYIDGSSIEFEKADNDNFKVYEEYNEEDYTFETIEEIIVEENEANPEWERQNKIRKSNGNMSKLEKAFQFNYRSSLKNNKHNVRLVKPENYPHGFCGGEDASNKIEKYQNKCEERENLKEKWVKNRMNRYNSTEEIMTASLKREISKQFNKETYSRGRERSSSVSQKYRLSNFTQEVSK